MKEWRRLVRLGETRTRLVSLPSRFLMQVVNPDLRLVGKWSVETIADRKLLVLEVKEDTEVQIG